MDIGRLGFRESEMKTKIWITLAVLIWTIKGSAEPVVTEYEDLRIDWTNLRISFMGIGQAESYEQALLKAWDNGLLAARNSSRKLFEVHLGGLAESGSAAKAGSKVARTTFEVETRFGPAGEVVVFMQSLLVNAFDNGLQHRMRKENELISGGSSSKYTGILLKVSTLVEPTPVFSVKTVGGQSLYDLADVKPISFARNLMGRWLRQPSKGELLRAVGPKPLQLDVRWNGKAFLIRNAAQAAAVSAFDEIGSDAKVAILLPSA